MKKIITIFLTLLGFLSAIANNGKEIKQAESFKNESDEAVYVVLKLAKGETFENTTKKVFQIYTQKDFDKRNFSTELESKIEQYRQSEKLRFEKLNELEKQIQNEDNQKNNP